jgi:putative membrane protein insertion efficiency factor
VLSCLLINSVSFAQIRDDLSFMMEANPIIKQEAKRKEDGFTLRETSEIKLVCMGLIRLYQLFISSQDGSFCNFIPSCSRFGMAAFRKYGPIHGLLMTSDRLLRCNGVGRRYYSSFDPKTGRVYDPVDAYYLEKKVNEF